MVWAMTKIAHAPGVALITGASSGLGRAIARMLVDEGWTVHGTAREPAKTMADVPNVFPHALDLTDLEAVERFIQREAPLLDHVSLLVNNAGAGVLSALESFPPEAWDRQFDLLLRSPVRLTQAVYASMLRRGGGTVVNVSSLAAELPIPCLPAYNAAKAGLSGFTRGLMLECAQTGVVVIDFRPGDYQTDFNRRMQAVGIEHPAASRAWQALEREMRQAPTVDRAAADLRRALAKGRCATVRSGSFFQARIAPVAVRWLPDHWLRALIRRYYGLHTS